MTGRTAGTLLGGRVAYAQLGTGYRTGIEPVLMAAAVPARAGETMLEAGCGAGAALLCLLHRVPGLRGTGVEIDPDLAALARDNAAANAADATIAVLDVAADPLPPSDHVMANPPWHDPSGTLPPDPARSRALHGDGLRWIGPLAAAARASLTLALPATATAAAMAGLHQAGMRRIALFPLWPHPGVAARLVLLQARRGAEGCRIAPGLVLHRSGGGYTDAAEAVLRQGAGLDLGG